MSEMTKEQVELLRTGLLASEWCGYVKRPMVNALCDLALSALTARSEGFREGVEAAAKVCDSYAHAERSADDTSAGMWSAGPYVKCALAIRALTPPNDGGERG